MRNHSLSAFFLAALAPLAVAVATLPGCIGTSVGNPPGADVKLAVVGSGSVSSPPAASPQAAPIELSGGIVIKEAWVSLAEIGLHAAGTCGQAGGKPNVPGPIAAELVTGSIYPEAPYWERAADESYCAFRARVRPLSDPLDNVAPELIEHSVLIRGERGDRTPFEARVNLTDLIMITGSKSPEIHLDASVTELILVFDFEGWFDPALMDAAEVKDGLILITANSNKEMEKSLRLQIPSSSHLFQDANRDGRLNPGDDEF